MEKFSSKARGVERAHSWEKIHFLRMPAPQARVGSIPMWAQETEDRCSREGAMARQSSVHEVELRKFRRHAQILAATLSWTSKSNKAVFSKGLTRDIGAGGAFIQLGRRPPPGTAVRYEVFLPAVHRRGPSVRIAGSGEIVRVERLGGIGHWHGVAVRFLRQMISVQRIAQLE